ncbi:hypothetical protein [Bradyrhizobium japonicum]|uniref:hypothetical protein n=1 Tax=Bradyrhizobium japonicum TaxID=375 RepID=UPI001E3E6EE3|nr:hypothetical protein [Bradyrhizobium japonicum]MCD9824045.1 hypothetical protein [Bradyrhizobium japonicum]MCD9896599.1 hypothetical protein [Bradyrhizobium japonicum]MEB2671092.1 hypothetical protein [Bradyrhizobium japonicum]WLB28667.1 hypothetical protein QIH85_44055 [Bradyrhizobium japonicum]WRI90415.1 hypothetical protein R3F75_05500 [Bradyrhizobium japonicum]
MNSPPFADSFIFADDARLAAQLSSLLAMPGHYVAVCNGPRMQRPDRKLEVLRRHNAMGRTRTKTAFMAGLPESAVQALSQSLAARRQVPCIRISSSDDIASAIPRTGGRDILTWGRDRIGIGLLKALRGGQEIVFEDKQSPYEWIPSKSGHIVVCEQGEEISEVIAANYAYALDAGLFLIPEVDRDRAHEILEAFYSLNDRPGLTPQEAQAGLTQELLNLCGSIPVPEYGSITFVGSLPYGFAYPEHPSTHLFKYPDLGSAVVNGFAAEQQLQPGTGVVMLVDPGTTPAPEIKSAVDLLEPRRAFIRVYEDRGANVRHVSEMVEHFPYDLLIFATHCGDSSGYRQTYEYTDSEGLNRTMVVDLAVGFQRTDDPEILKVGHFFRFVSLDGVDWTDRTAKAKLYVGEAVHDFNRLMDSGPSTFKYTKRETIDRVVGSSAMMMSDSNFIFAQHSIAGMGTPVIINNACVSWHRLAGDMTFAGARAYIGTLFPVTPIEASEVVTRILDAHWGKPLAIALWAAQRDVYERSQRRPYVVSGVYPQRLRVERLDYPPRIRKRLGGNLAGWKDMLAGLSKSDAKRIEAVEEIIRMHERELQHFEDVRNRNGTQL